jgi:hypothetical protein
MKKNRFHEVFTKYLLVLATATTLFLTLISAASGRPFRLGKIPDRGKNFGCGTCHVNPRGGGQRNSFGYDYETISMKAGEKYTEDLGALDSDGDGFTNDQEFGMGTHPGDQKSKP